MNIDESKKRVAARTREADKAAMRLDHDLIKEALEIGIAEAQQIAALLITARECLHGTREQDALIGQAVRRACSLMGELDQLVKLTRDRENEQ